MLAGIIGGAIGGVANIIGAVGKKNEAFGQLKSQRRFADKQRQEFNAGYEDLMSQAKSAPIYQGDISRFQKVEQQADLAKRMASGMSRGSGEQIARDQAAQTTANVLAAAQRGAGSGTDIMTAALMAQQGENQAQNAISARSAQEQMAMQNMAQQQQFAALGQTAAASARERGLEFQSLANRQAGIMGVSQNKLSGQLNLNQQLFDSEQAKAAALAEAKGAIWSGIGGLASGIGGGLMQMQNQSAQMDMLKTMYGGGAGAGGNALSGGGAFAANTIGSGTSLAQTINPSFGQMQQLPTSRINLPQTQAPIYSSGYDGLGNSVTPFFNN